MTNASRSPDTDRFLLELYEGCKTVPFTSFQRWALARLRRLVDFDAGWWGKASISPSMIVRSYACAAAGAVLEGYREVARLDYFHDALLSRPGITIDIAQLMDRKEYTRTLFYARYAKGRRMESLLGTATVEAESADLEFLSVWRFDADRPFSAADRHLKERLMPHLQKARQISCLVSLRHLLPYERGPGSPWAWAFVGADDGSLIEANALFVGMIRQEWIGWMGAVLPRAIQSYLKACRTFKGQKIRIDFREVDGCRLATARAILPYDRLGDRERLVAQRYANSESYRSIAESLGTSPATVRNQLARAYRKLGVHNKIDLVKALDRVRQG